MLHLKGVGSVALKNSGVNSPMGKPIRLPPRVVGLGQVDKLISRTNIEGRGSYFTSQLRKTTACGKDNGLEDKRQKGTRGTQSLPPGSCRRRSRTWATRSRWRPRSSQKESADVRRVRNSTRLGCSEGGGFGEIPLPF